MRDTVNQRLRRVTSPQNALLRQMRRAFHQGTLTEDGYCAIESVRIIEEAIRSGLRFKAVIFSDSASHDDGSAHRLLPQIGSHVETVVIPDAVFTTVVATENPQGVAALVKLKECSLDGVLAQPNPLILVAVGLQDPGNLGAILRSAEAFGVHAVLLAEGSVSPYNAKVVRASAGSLFRCCLAQENLASALPLLRHHGLRLVATSARKGRPLHKAQLAGPLALFIGNEGTGLSSETLAKLDEAVMVPHSPAVESLNAAVAASIVLYEIARQRSH